MHKIGYLQHLYVDVPQKQTNFWNF